VHAVLEAVGVHLLGHGGQRSGAARSGGEVENCAECGGDPSIGYLQVKQVFDPRLPSVGERVCAFSGAGSGQSR